MEDPRSDEDVDPTVARCATACKMVRPSATPALLRPGYHLLAQNLGLDTCAYLQGSTGTMMGKRRLDFDIKTEGGQVPDFSLNLSSTSKVWRCTAA